MTAWVTVLLLLGPAQDLRASSWCSADGERVVQRAARPLDLERPAVWLHTMTIRPNACLPAKRAGWWLS